MPGPKSQLNPGNHIVTDVTGECLGCEYNDGSSFCKEHKKFAYMLLKNGTLVCVKYPDEPPIPKREVNRKVTGLTGVYKRKDKYVAQFTVRVPAKNKYIGTYDTKEQAMRALALKEIERFGERKSNLHIKVVTE